jgi:hypothetical protein
MFDHLKKLDVRGCTAWMDLPEVSRDARLHMKPIGEFNEGYVNAMLKMSARRMRHAVKVDDLDLSKEENIQMRAEDRELYPLYVIIDWEGVLDDNGEPVECTEDARREFCEQLPNWIFDRVRTFAATPEKFLGKEAVPNAGELAKNSEGGSSGS